MLIKGIDLNPKQKQQVLATFVHRCTYENGLTMQSWKLCKTNKQYMLSDNDWLAEHAFYFIKDGSRLSAKHKQCEPSFMAD